MKKGSLKRVLFGALLVTLLLGMNSGTVMAKKRNTWFTTKHSRVFYYDEDGRTLKNGRYKIDGKYYYFDEKGVQRTGWQKVGDDYYYFNIGQKKKGSMVKSETVNGIQLRKTGRARMTSYAKKKLPILYAANQKMQEITKCADSKSEKLKKIYDYMVSDEWLKKSYYLGSFHKNETDWDIYYASKVFISPRYFSGKIGADCYTYASTFAYLANAVGYTASVRSTGSHGYCVVGDYAYDPSWQRLDWNHSYYKLPLKTGPSGINYGATRKYSITI